jgi:hypothetical protein
VCRGSRLPARREFSFRSPERSIVSASPAWNCSDVPIFIGKGPAHEPFYEPGIVIIAAGTPM